MSILTCAVVAPRFTSVTRPFSTLRALSFIAFSVGTLSSIVAHSRRTASRSGRLLQPRQQPVDQEDQDEEQQRERDGDVELALAGLEHHRGRQRACLSLD